jgi:hypothetical protein
VLYDGAEAVLAGNAEAFSGIARATGAQLASDVTGRRLAGVGHGSPAPAPASPW